MLIVSPPVVDVVSPMMRRDEQFNHSFSDAAATAASSTGAHFTSASFNIFNNPSIIAAGPSPPRGGATPVLTDPIAVPVPVASASRIDVPQSALGTDEGMWYQDSRSESDDDMVEAEGEENADLFLAHDDAKRGAHGSDYETAYPLEDLKSSDKHKPHKCYGCLHLPTSALYNNMPVLHANEVTRLVNEMKDGLMILPLSEHARSLSRTYEHKIRRKANARLKIGQTPLPEWSPGMVKQHLKASRHPLVLFKLNLERINGVIRDSTKAAREVHNKYRTVHGHRAKRVNPLQWKIMKEAIELETKLLEKDLKQIVQNYEKLGDTNWADNVVLNMQGRATVYNTNQAAIAYEQTNRPHDL